MAWNFGQLYKGPENGGAFGQQLFPQQSGGMGPPMGGGMRSPMGPMGLGGMIPPPQQGGGFRPAPLFPGYPNQPSYPSQPGMMGFGGERSVPFGGGLGGLGGRGGGWSRQLMERERMKQKLMQMQYGGMNPYGRFGGQPQRFGGLGGQALISGNSARPII